MKFECKRGRTTRIAIFLIFRKHPAHKAFSVLSRSVLIAVIEDPSLADALLDRQISANALEAFLEEASRSPEKKSQTCVLLSF